MIRSASQITSIMQNENSSENRNTESRPKRLTVTLVRRGAPKARERSARRGRTVPPNYTSMTGGSGVGACVKGSSAVVVILAPGKVLRVRRGEGKHPEARDHVRNGPSPAKRKRTCATAAIASMAGATIQDAGSTSV